MTKTPWIRAHDGAKGFYGFSCARCGNAEQLPDQSIPIDAWVTWAKGYLRQHSKCKEKPLTAVPVLADQSPSVRVDHAITASGEARESIDDKQELSVQSERRAVNSGVSDDSRGGSTKLCGRCGINPARPRRRFINGKRYDTIQMCARCDAIRKRSQKNSISKHIRQTQNDWANPKYRASVALRMAVRRGIVIKPDKCSNCLKSVPARSLHGHHDDYFRPYKVKWMCSTCHAAFHRKYK